MKNVLVIFAVIFAIGNIMMSVTATFFDVYANQYLKEYENIKSFKNKKLYMADDAMLIERAYEDTGIDNGMPVFVIEGVLLSDNSKVRLAVGEQEYLRSNLDKQPLYRSKLTNNLFLRNAPKEYYKDKFISFYLGIYFKITFYVIIGIAVYILIRYIKVRRYRLY